MRVAINGFGRIGRLVLRSIVEHARRDIERTWRRLEALSRAGEPLRRAGL